MTSTTDVTEGPCIHIGQIRADDAGIYRSQRIVNCNGTSTAGRFSHMRGILGIGTRHEKLQEENRRQNSDNHHLFVPAVHMRRNAHGAQTPYFCLPTQEKGSGGKNAQPQASQP